MSEIEITLKIILALVFGGVLGLEREIRKKQAGLRTYSLVCVAACLLAIISLSLAGQYESDPIRVLEAVVTGIGFVGAGVIIFRQDKVEGVTTAAGLLTVSGIGLAVGFGFYYLASLVVITTFIIFYIFKKLEKKILHRPEED